MSISISHWFILISAQHFCCCWCILAWFSQFCEKIIRKHFEKNWQLSFYGIQKVEVKLIFETSSIGIFTGTYMISLSSFIIIAQSLQLLSNWIWSEIITNSVPHVTQIILPIFQFKRHVWSENRSSLISYNILKSQSCN